MHVLSWGGVVVSGLVVAGVFPGPCLALLWMAYLSLMVVGQPFLGYQWDVLLLEAGLLGILFAPWNAWIGWARWEPSTVVLWLIRWLVFRVMFLSGVVKLTSGDPTWRAWEALRYHYETQPLPTWTSWYVHQAAGMVPRGVGGVHVLGGADRPVLRLRPAPGADGGVLEPRAAASADRGDGQLRVLQPAVDRALPDAGGGPRLGPEVRRRRRRSPPAMVAPGGSSRRSGAIIVMVTTMEGLDRAGSTIVYPAPLEVVRRWVAPLHSMNAYGLFAVMTTERPEIIVEGSEDGETWKPYTFRWKPGDLARRPRFTTPHMPRLDWQMWFAALAGDCRSQGWFLAFERRLLEGSPEVLGLLRETLPTGRRDTCGRGCSSTSSPVVGRRLVAEGGGRDVLSAGGVVIPGDDRPRFNGPRLR